jgi:hypothetical protein
MFYYGSHTRREKVRIRREDHVIYNVTQPISTYGMRCHILNANQVYTNK